MDTKRFNEYYKGTDTFKYVNPNPMADQKKTFVWDRGDCAIRALANSIGCTWLDSFDFLSAKARRDYNVPNDMGGFRKWVCEEGAIWYACKAERGKSRMTCKEFAEAHPTGCYVIQIANHFTACKEGKILDVWNCGQKAVVGFFDMMSFKI